MTSKEKIEKAWELVNSKRIETNEEIQLVRYAVRRACELEDRDTPMKVIVIDYNAYCDNCGNHLFKKTLKHCDDCGQRLDWGNKDE